MESTERTEFGFARSSCSCGKCRVFCRFKPGALVPADLDRLIPQDADPYAWAEEHLRAYGIVTMHTPAGLVAFGPLVPAKSADGACHWFQGNLCAVHKNSPYGCAFFDDCQQTPAEAQLRAKTGDLAIAEEWPKNGLYSRLWFHLWERGLRDCRTAQDEMLLHAELRKLDDASP